MGTDILRTGEDRLGIIAGDGTVNGPNMQGSRIIIRQIGTSIEPKSSKCLGIAKKGNKLFIGIIHRIEPVDPLRRSTIGSSRRSERRDLPKEGQNMSVGELNGSLRTMKGAGRILRIKRSNSGHDGKRENSKGDSDERQPALCEGTAPFVTHHVSNRTVTLTQLQFPGTCPP